MLYVEIRRADDGVVRVYHENEAWEEGSDYLWSEGNFACDCNRSLFFARAVGDEGDEGRECGDAAFVIRIKDDDGKVVYQDEDWEK